jgi:protein tyrosine phosphatase
MVLQETVGPVGVIVMLTPTFESNKEKCAQYFPLDSAHPILLPAEQISAELPNQNDGKAA